jgi:hypothetical protein
MDNKTKKLIEELNQLKGQLSERFIFGDEGGQEQQMGGHPDMQHEHPEMGGNDQPDPSLVQPQPQQQMMQGNSEEEIAMHAQEIIQHEPIIGKIRETAIEGLKKYADHPTSAIYEFFKKVFLESDKVLTDTGNKR